MNASRRAEIAEMVKTATLYWRHQNSEIIDLLAALEAAEAENAALSAERDALREIAAILREKVRELDGYIEGVIEP